MADNERDRLLRLMGEAAALRPDDALRREVEAMVAAAGSWAEREWLALLRFDEEMRLSLNRVPVPPQLEHALLTTLETGGRSRPAARRPSRRAAATVLVGLAAGAALLMLQPGSTNHILNQVAILAAGEHFDQGAVDVETSQPDVLERALADQIPFPVVLPDLGDRFRLAGGQKCSLARHTVVYSRWRSSGKPHSLYQFQPDDFGLPDRFRRTTLSVDDGCSVTLWTEHGRGYALVAESSAPSPDPLE